MRSVVKGKKIFGVRRTVEILISLPTYNKKLARLIDLFFAIKSKRENRKEFISNHIIVMGGKKKQQKEEEITLSK